MAVPKSENSPKLAVEKEQPHRPQVFLHKRTSTAPTTHRPTVQQLRALMMERSLERVRKDEKEGAAVNDQQLMTSESVFVYGCYDGEHEGSGETIENAEHSGLHGAEYDVCGDVHDSGEESELSSTLPSTSCLTFDGFLPTTQ